MGALSTVATQAVILRVLPFRESSVICALFTRAGGLTHGILKGVRKEKRSMPVERGLIVEITVYYRPHRELQTLSNISIVNHYPNIRESLLKTALRDVAFELALKTLTHVEPHPELFDLFAVTLQELDRQDDTSGATQALWRFYLRYASLLGFDLDLEQCIECGVSIVGQGGQMNWRKGGIMCENCIEQFDPARWISGEIRQVLAHLKNSENQLLTQLDAADQRSITRMLASYCEYHFDVSTELKSVAFLDELF